MTKKSNSGGLVYSTNKSFQLNEEDEDRESQDKPNEKQTLRVSLDRKQRAGKEVTMIEGFQMNEDRVADLAKKLKSYCGSGGTVKDNQILIQGDHRKKIEDFLKKQAFKVKVV
jgi:translation initiation factor 1